ncbi:MAG: PaaX family transcriptional regulator C-terminal domain-containing protein [Gemmatimonadaceae bacterium]
MIDKILSSLKSATTSDFIYSSLSFFGSKRGPLPGLWFVEAISSLGIEEQAIRQTLFRLERTGVVVSKRKGRQKWYSASPATEAVLRAGRERVAVPVEASWDGNWTLVHFRVGEDDRDTRDRLRDVLLVQGFGALGPGLYLHPRDRSDGVVDAATKLGIADKLNVFRGPHIAGPNVSRLAHELWDVAAIAARYRKFQKRFSSIANDPLETLKPSEAFAVRFGCMFEFFRITWDDPSLPPDLLPAEWPAEEARETANTLIRGLLPGAVQYADEVLQRVTDKATTA